jgi:hypothetical protein
MTRYHTPAGKFLKWGKTLPAGAISDLLVLRLKKPHSLCAKFEMKNANIFDVNAEASWPSLADKIISQHID